MNAEQSEKYVMDLLKHADISSVSGKRIYFEEEQQDGSRVGVDAMEVSLVLKKKAKKNDDSEPEPCGCDN